MGENSHIQWTHHTFNPWVGCAHVSPGCNNCYAEQQNYFVNIQRSRGRELWGKDAERHIASESTWRKPFAWDRAAHAAGKRHRVFCASLADVFEDREDVRTARVRLMATIAMTANLDWLLLTKRPENVTRLLGLAYHDALAGCALPASTTTAATAMLSSWRIGNRAPTNVWMGVTGEDATRLGKRVEILSSVPAVVRFVSAEPLLEDIGDDLAKILGMEWCNTDHDTQHLPGGAWFRRHPSMVDWVILGGESGPRARECDVEWIRHGVDVCRAAHVAPFVKQLGSRSFDADFVGDAGIKHPKGGEMKEWPADLRVQEFPQPRRV